MTTNESRRGTLLQISFKASVTAGEAEKFLHASGLEPDSWSAFDDAHDVEVSVPSERAEKLMEHLRGVSDMVKGVKAAA